jgi:hypothetical protein
MKCSHANHAESPSALVPYLDDKVADGRQRGLLFIRLQTKEPGIHKSRRCKITTLLLVNIVTNQQAEYNADYYSR